MKTDLFFVNRLPRLPMGRTLLIFDRRLEPVANHWIRKFPYRYGVVSGEKLKSLDSFPRHARRLLSLWPGESPVQVAAFGGGSVGDFAGFFASVAQRGVPLIQIPTTWLSAIDSAHGGKTALNALAKNELGTFHPAQAVYLVREVLLALPKERLRESFGEALKIALLQGGTLWSRVLEVGRKGSAPALWRILPELVEAKLRIVRRDPFEKKGDRRLLNLGHTLGHVFEARTGLPHGEAITLGIYFSLLWSRSLGHRSTESILAEMSSLAERGLIPGPGDYVRVLRGLRGARDLLSRDKKRASKGRIHFIFIDRPGYAFQKKVSLGEIDDEIQRQKKSVSIQRFS